MKDGQMNIILHNYKIIKKIGEGTYGRVWAAKKDGKQFAIKQVTFNDHGILQLREMDIVNRCSHPHIIKFVDMFIDLSIQKIKTNGVKKYVINSIQNRTTPDLVVKAIYYVMLLADNTLETFVCTDRFAKYTIKDKLRLIFQIISAIGFLHDNMLCHGDLKPENVLMYGDIPVLIDFGLSYSLDAGCPCTPTPYCASPETLFSYPNYKSNFILATNQQLEILQNRTDDKIAVEMWCIGIIIPLILTGKHIFYRTNEDFIDNILLYMEDQNTYLRKCSIEDRFIPLLKTILHPSSNLRLKDVKSILCSSIFLEAGYKDMISGTMITHSSYHNSMSKENLNISIDWIFKVCYSKNTSVRCYLLAIDLFYRCYDLLNCEYSIPVIIAACISIADKLDGKRVMDTHHLLQIFTDDSNYEMGQSPIHSRISDSNINPGNNVDDNSSSDDSDSSSSSDDSDSSSSSEDSNSSSDDSDSNSSSDEVVNKIVDNSINRFDINELVIVETEILFKLSGILGTNTLYDYCIANRDIGQRMNIRDFNKFVISVCDLIGDRDKYISTDLQKYVTDMKSNIGNTHGGPYVSPCYIARMKIFHT